MLKGHGTHSLFCPGLLYQEFNWLFRTLLKLQTNNKAERKAHLISRMWPHQRNLVVPSPEQSPNSVQLSLKDRGRKHSCLNIHFQLKMNLHHNHQHACNIQQQFTARLTLMGVYHLLCCGGLRGGFRGLGSYGSNSCSGILTTAFLGLSSLAPSSVDPFSPHRT